MPFRASPQETELPPFEMTQAQAKFVLGRCHKATERLRLTKTMRRAVAPKFFQMDERRRADNWRDFGDSALGAAIEAIDGPNSDGPGGRSRSAEDEPVASYLWRSADKPFLHISAATRLPHGVGADQQFAHHRGFLLAGTRSPRISDIRFVAHASGRGVAKFDRSRWTRSRNWWRPSMARRETDSVQGLLLSETRTLCLPPHAKRTQVDALSCSRRRVT